MKTSPENEIKRIYEKSVRLLNDKQARLMDMQQVLKKAVIRLSLASRSDNEQVNNVLTEMNISVADNIDLNMLDKHLDKLFLLINHADFRVDEAEKTALYTYLKAYLGDRNNPSLSDEVVHKIKTLIANKLPDEEVSAELVKSLSEIDKDFSNSKQQYSDSISLFIKDISESTGFTFDRAEIETPEVMQDLAIELAKFIYSKNNKSKVSNNDTGDNNHVSDILNEIVNQLALPSSSKNDKFDVIKALNSPGDKTWKNIVDKLVQLVNQSIGSVQQEKQALETYLVKVSAQLADIESFMHGMCRDTDEASSISLALTDSVEAGVSSIEKTITKSTNLTVLKHDVATNLKEIRKHVVDYKHAEKVKNDIALQSYSKMINELIDSQKESDALQEQLHESKVKLLRDPLTGIANRLAYDERIDVEYNRWKRTNTPLCLAVWDIDHFKKINDKYGHAVGDRVLKLFADIIYSKIRKVDMFARIGGEEFVLVMPDTSLEKAMMLNNKLRLSLDECNFHYDGQQCQITSSVGIAEFRRGDDADIALDKADKALYQSKNNGRNRCTAFDDI
jgi:diguanylate cyclase